MSHLLNIALSSRDTFITFQLKYCKIIQSITLEQKRESWDLKKKLWNLFFFFKGIFRSLFPQISYFINLCNKYLNLVQIIPKVLFKI